MSSEWDVVIAGNGLELLKPFLDSWAERQERAAAFHLWPTKGNSDFYGMIPVIAGTVNHLDPDSLMEQITRAQKCHWQIFPVTVVLRNEYDAHDAPHTVWVMNEDGTWR